MPLLPHPQPPHVALQSTMKRAWPPQNGELSVFHHPAGIDPGGHAFLPALTEQQNTVHPEPQSAPGPQPIAAYALPGFSTYSSGLTASAEPTTADFARKLRRDEFLPNCRLTRSTTRSDMVASALTA